MAIPKTAPDDLAQSSMLAGGLTDPLQGNDVLQSAPSAASGSSLIGLDVVAPPQNIDQEVVELAGVRQLTRPLIRLFSGDFDNLFGRSADQLEDLRTREQLPDEPDNDALLDDMQTVDAGVRVKDTGIASEEQAAELTAAMDQPAQISDDGMLRDFRAVGSAGDAKIPDEGSILSTIDGISQTYRGTIDEATRGVQTEQATRELADYIGVTPNKLTNNILNRKRGGVIFQEGMGLAETMLAARDLLVKESETLDGLAKKAATGTDEDALAFRQQMELVAQMQAQIKGSQTEIARALGSFRIPARTGSAPDALRGTDLTAMLNQHGGADNIRDMADAYNKANTRSQRLAVARKGATAKTFDAFYEAWINILLSSPVTHTKNTVGALLTTFAHIPETVVGGAIGTTRRAMGGQGGMYVGEGRALMFGAMMSMRDAFAAAGRSFKTGERPIAGSKIEMVGGRDHINAFSAEGFGASGGIGKSVDMLGKFLTLNRVPTRALEFEDTFFKVMAQRMSLYQNAYRTGRTKGLNGEGLSTHIAEYLMDPPADALKGADAHAQYVTLQTDLDRLGKDLNGVRNNALMRLMVPFFKTPYNATKYAMIDRSPIGLAFGESSRIIKRGRAPDATDADRAAADMAKARIAMGSATMGVVVSYTIDGHITGAGPNDPDLRRAMLRSGWQPYSVRVGDQYYSYQGSEPFSSIIGMAADFAEVGIGGYKDSDNMEKVANGLIAAAANQVTDKTFMSGFADFVATLNDPSRYGGGTVDRLTRSMVPRVFAQIERSGLPLVYEGDPTVRAARDALQQMRSQVPALSESLEAKRNFWGMKVFSSGAAGPDLISPIYSSTYGPNKLSEIDAGMGAEAYAETAFAIDQEFIDLRYGPSKHPEVMQKGVGLTDREIAIFHQYAGMRSFERLSAMIEDDTYKALKEAAMAGDLDAREVLHNTFDTQVTKARLQAKQDLVNDQNVGPAVTARMEAYGKLQQEKRNRINEAVR